MPSSNIMSTIWRIYKGVRLFIHVHDDMLRCAHIGSPCSCFFFGVLIVSTPNFVTQGSVWCASHYRSSEVFFCDVFYYDSYGY